ncbi:MAG TPA: iron-containing redox enzyme family protein [Candidatus Binataceae bacterium]|nr:iron-containing redox enzyme family protein [Candidatus Binataceae bacterium]
MDKDSFEREIAKLVEEFRLDRHPYILSVYQGKASREQLRGYPIQHYEMTVRDAAYFAAEGYLQMRQLDAETAEDRARNFAEEALGVYSHSASHLELLFELWEGGLGLPRKELIEARTSDAARILNALILRLKRLKPTFMGASGLLEEMEVEAYRMMGEGLAQHYHIDPRYLRFFSVHHEADKDHGKAGHAMIQRFVLGSGREAEFLSEARLIMGAFWRGFESMSEVG